MAAHAAWNVGLGIFLAVIGAIFFGWLIRYVLRTNDERERRLVNVIEQNLSSNTTAIQHLTTSIRDHEKQWAQLWTVQRDEQRQMLKLIGQVSEQVSRCHALQSQQ